MDQKNKIVSSSVILKSHVNRFAMIGLLISIASILIATAVVSFQLTGGVSLDGLLQAQMSNPAIWALNLTPFMFAYWGQAFCYGLVDKAESILEDKELEFHTQSSDFKSKLLHESNYDSITQLPNRRLITEKIEQTIHQLNNNDKVAVIVLRLNDLNNSNYNMGVLEYNQILTQFSNQLKQILLEPFMLSANLGMATLAKMENHDFVILLPKLSFDIHLLEIIAQIHELTSLDFMFDGLQIHLNTTISATMYPEHGNDADTLLYHAHIGILNAEKEKKAYALYTQTIEEGFTQNRRLIAEVKQALDNDMLEIYYQPEVKLNTGKVVGAEALIRLNSNELGIVSAAKIIPLIEGSHLNDLWTNFILKKAIHQLSLWHQSGHEINLTVNLTETDVSNPQLPSLIKDLLETHQIPSSFFCAELTEKACLSHPEKTYKVLNELSSMGVTIAIDNFCSGYTSFVYLTQFPINRIKIQKSFIMNMMHDEKSLNLIKAMTEIAKTLKLLIFAIGITDKETMNQLINFDCHYGQGFYFSPAVSAEKFKQIFDADYLYVPETHQVLNEMPVILPGART